MERPGTRLPGSVDSAVSFDYKLSLTALSAFFGADSKVVGTGRRLRIAVLCGNTYLRGLGGSSMRNATFTKTPLAIGIAVALSTAATIPALAQQDAAVEEILVTGIRGSLQASMDLKRDAAGVVDAITAEDMGDFPDTNLAESLQRITGVSIDRNRGEGSRITVRGFGPDFNLVLLNGRQMPTTSGLNRSFDFANLASEGISAVEVYKTGNAALPTGGVGSTINVRSTRPLDRPGLHTAIAAGGMYDDSRTKRDDPSVTPELSALFSNTFAEDTIGVSLTAIYQERKVARRRPASAAGGPFPATSTIAGAASESPNGVAFRRKAIRTRRTGRATRTSTPCRRSSATPSTITTGRA